MKKSKWSKWLRRNNRALVFVSIGLFSVFATFVAIFQVQKTQRIVTEAQTASFRFAALNDTNGNYSITQEIIPQVVALNPKFTIFSGDLETVGYTQSGMNSWKTAMGSMFSKTLAVRGNHDNTTSGSAGNWADFFDFQSVAKSVNATNYSALDADLTYSFDYGNSHFVGIDGPGDISKITAAQISWLDQDLTAAELRGVTHTFLFWHGPTYYVASHASNPQEQLIAVINKHPSVSATFHGHEHVQSHVHMTSSKVSLLTHEYEQFTGGSMGGGSVSCAASRSDWCLSRQGFAVIDVNGLDVTVSFYAKGSTTADKTVAFHKTTQVSVSPPFYCEGSQYCAPSPMPSQVISSAPTTPVVNPTLAITQSVPQPTDSIDGQPGDDNPKHKSKNGNLIALLLELIRAFFELLLRLFDRG